MKKLIYILCVALLFTACSSNAPIAPLRPASDNSETVADVAYLINNSDDLKENSTDIVKGTVTELSSKVVSTDVHVYVSVKITEVSKGDLESGNEITIVRSRMSNDGGKTFDKGKRGEYAECNVGTEYIFFLRGPDKTYKDRGVLEEVYYATYRSYAFPVPGKTRSAQSEVELLLENSNFSTESKEKYYDLYAEVKEEYMK